MRRASSMFQMQMERYSKENMQSTLALFNQAQKRSGGSEMSRYANKFSSSSYNKNFGASFFAYQASPESAREYSGSGEGVIGAKGSANIGRAYAGSSASKYSATSGGKK